jgi:hypothetical protein
MFAPFDGVEFAFEGAQVAEEEVHDLIEAEGDHHEESSFRRVFWGRISKEEQIDKGGEVDEEGAEHQPEGKPHFDSLSRHDWLLVLVYLQTVVDHKHILLLKAADSADPLQNLAKATDDWTLGDAFKFCELFCRF